MATRRASVEAPGIAIAQIETPIGPMIAGALGDTLCLLEFADPNRLDAQVATMSRRFGTDVARAESPLFDRLRAELREYFAGSRRAFTLPLIAPGTPFQERVWARLLEIPYGETISYDTLARSVGAPDAQRAVGQANGMNRLAILIPCHRVVNKSGRLGGYGGELWRKEFLLKLEGRTDLLDRLDRDV